MKEGRPTQSEARIRWWAVACFVVFLGVFSAAAGHRDSGCGEEPKAAACGSVQGGCCCQTDGLPGVPYKAAAGVMLTGTPVLPTLGEVKVCAHDRNFTVNRSGQRSCDFLVPPELRLGSALWSHAPPTRAA
jgi:hypothetical protein